MKKLGLVLILAGVVAGAGLLANYVSGMSRKECDRQCPTAPDALRVVFSAGPFALALCRCPKD